MLPLFQTPKTRLAEIEERATKSSAAFRAELLALPGGGSPEATRKNMEVLCDERQPLISSVLDSAVYYYLKQLAKDPRKYLKEFKAFCDGRADQAHEPEMINKALKLIQFRAAGKPGLYMLQSPIFQSMKLNFKDVLNQESESRMRAAIFTRRGLTCPESLGVEDAECACLLAEARAQLLNILPPGQDDHVRELRTHAQKAFIQRIKESRLSAATQGLLIAKAQTDFPPIELAGDDEVNASYLPAPPHFKVHLADLMVPGFSESVFEHEIGHYFEDRLNDPDVAHALTRKDVQVLSAARDCIDRNILLGETSSGNLEVAQARRGEYLGDLFWVQSLRSHGVTPSERKAFAIHTAFLCPKTQVADPNRLPTDPGFDPHARADYRIPYLAAGIGALPAPDRQGAYTESCEGALFHKR